MNMEDKLMGGFVFAFIFVICALPFVAIAGCSEHYSDGERSGVVTKFSHKGIFVKTWEGEMNLGGAVPGGKGGWLVSNIWEFTVQDGSLVSKLQEAQRSGKPITVKYNEWLIGPAFRTDSGYYITEIISQR